MHSIVISVNKTYRLFKDGVDNQDITYVIQLIVRHFEV